MSGQRPRASDDLYAEVIHVLCPECGAGVDAKCVNRFTSQSARTPCHKRITAAKEGRS